MLIKSRRFIESDEPGDDSENSAMAITKVTETLSDALKKLTHSEKRLTVYSPLIE
jgi:hypothetical protein